VPRAIRLLRADEPRGKISDTVILNSDERRNQRAHVVTVQGMRIELDLPEPATLRTDDVLALDTGEVIDVVAAAEPLIEVRGDLTALSRIAWALGDRHVPVQILSNRIRLRAEQAHNALIASLGGKMRPIEAPFEPEGGAYAVAHGDHHGSDGGHAHGHDHHGHRHDHKYDDHT
jgi:urease accessory protein